jgi:membrane complex biogenesis BtpA family protein
MGVLHLLPLPGGPVDSPGLAAVLERALADAVALREGGIEAAVIENFGDAPFMAGRVDPHVPAMMGVIGARVRAETGLDLGVNVLRNDVAAALGVAAACGASFVRVNVHIGAAWTDQGLIQGKAYETLRYRRELGSGGIRIAADVLVKHASPAGETRIEAVCQETALRGRADVLIVTGAHTGGTTSLREVERARAAVPDRPIWVGSGVTVSTIKGVAAVAGGAIVGTWLHRDGVLAAPLDVERVRRLVGALHG